MEWVTTSTILEGLRDFENREAWDALVLRFRSPVVRFGRGLGLDAEAAEEVAQETLLAFAESLRAGRYERDKGRLSKWLFGIAWRQAKRQQRRQARPEQAGPPAGRGDSFWRQVPDEDAAADTWEREWERAVLAECLARVRMEVRPITFEAFEMVIFQEQPPAETASALGVDVKAVYNAKHRVLKRMRELRPEVEELGTETGETDATD